LNDLLRRLQDLAQPTWENFVHVVDILIVAFVLYRILILVRSTRAWRILTGIVIFILLLFISDYLQLRTLHWLLEKATLLGPVALVILFLPELRQALEGFGKLRLIGDVGPKHGVVAAARTVEEIVGAVSELAGARLGALIVLERNDNLQEIISNGVSLDAEVSAALLGSIFFGTNPLHDGAVVIRNDRLVAAACRLPLSESTYIDKHVHMRHRAGIGMSEQADCLVIVVSEERGTISISQNGTLVRVTDSSELRSILNHELRGPDPDEKPKPKRKREKQGVAV